MLYRQGDVYFAAIDSVPTGAVRLPHCVLAEGEVTGHSHRVAEPDVAELLEHQGNRFLRVLARSAAVVHQEHAPIELPEGAYRVWQQREYSPRHGSRRVLD